MCKILKEIHTKYWFYVQNYTCFMLRGLILFHFQRSGCKFLYKDLNSNRVVLLKKSDLIFTEMHISPWNHQLSSRKLPNFQKLAKYWNYISRNMWENSKKMWKLFSWYRGGLISNMGIWFLVWGFDLQWVFLIQRFDILRKEEIDDKRSFRMKQ